jgi:hypothetical protein
MPTLVSEQIQSCIDSVAPSIPVYMTVPSNWLSYDLSTFTDITFSGHSNTVMIAFDENNNCLTQMMTLFGT